MNTKSKGSDNSSDHLERIKSEIFSTLNKETPVGPLPKTDVSTKQLIRLIAKSSGYHVYEVEDVIAHFVANMQLLLAREFTVKIDGIGKLGISKRNRREKPVSEYFKNDQPTHVQLDGLPVTGIRLEKDALFSEFCNIFLGGEVTPFASRQHEAIKEMKIKKNPKRKGKKVNKLSQDNLENFEDTGFAGSEDAGFNNE